MSISSSPTGLPFGVFLSGEQTENSDGSRTSTFRAAPFNLGGTTAIMWGFQWSVSAGIKVEYRNED